MASTIRIIFSACLLATHDPSREGSSLASGKRWSARDSRVDREQKGNDRRKLSIVDARGEERRGLLGDVNGRGEQEDRPYRCSSYSLKVSLADALPALSSAILSSRWPRFDFVSRPELAGMRDFAGTRRGRKPRCKAAGSYVYVKIHLAATRTLCNSHDFARLRPVSASAEHPSSTS